MCGLGNVIVIMPRLIAFQPCSKLGVQNRKREAKNQKLEYNFFQNRYRYHKKMERFRNREVLKPKCHTLVKIGISSPSDCHTLTWRIHYWETQCLPLNWKVVVSKEWNLPQCLKKSSPSFQMPQLRSWIKVLKYFIQFLSSHSNCALSSQAEEQCLLSAWVSKIQIAHLSHQQYFPFEEK